MQGALPIEYATPLKVKQKMNEGSVENSVLRRTDRLLTEGKYRVIEK